MLLRLSALPAQVPLIALVALMAVPAGISAPLEGKVEDVEVLSGVSPILRPGVQYNEKEVAPLTPSNLWVQLPTWFCGTWQINRETTVYRKNFSTGEQSYARVEFEAASKFTYGKQIDRQGHIWHYLGTPYTSETKMSQVTEHHQVLSKELVSGDEAKVVLKTRVIVFKVNRSTHRIIETYQQESTNTYTRGGDRQMTLKATTKVFDDQGKPGFLTTNEASAQKIDDFHIVNYENHKDLRALFIEYLTAKGLTILAPD